MRILYYGGCWPTNIGNAFIDLGATHLLRAAFPDAEVHMASEFPKWFFGQSKAGERAVSLADWIDCEVLAVAGMTCCADFVRTEGPVLLRAAARGAAVVFLGCGQDSYSAGESRLFADFLRELRPAAFISRDSETFARLPGCAPKSLDGIDCGFFLPEAFKPARVNRGDFAVLAFDSGPEPDLDPGMPVVRAHHDAWERKGRRPGREPDVLVSDLPGDYLNLYANCAQLHSDRVHACVAALAYGRRARFLGTTERARLFERVGAADVAGRLVSLDLARLGELKARQVEFVRQCVD